MTDPLITVYITNFNYGEFIRQSIESVLHQTCQDFELLIIDDGSTDNSRAIIETYANHPGVSIIYQNNTGLNITNNIAMRAARGKYIMRLDADDFLEHDALKVMSTLLEADPQLGLVFPDYYIVDAENYASGEIQRFNFKNEVSLLDQPAHGACTMIRKAFLIELGGYDESYSCQDGYELWIKFITHYPVQNVNKPLFHYRQHGNNLTSNENRILDTRSRIKSNFIDKHEIETPKTVVIIPVRNTLIRGQNIPLFKLGDQTVLEHVIAAAAGASKVCQVIVTSADAEIEEFVRNNHIESSKVTFIKRPKEFARINEPLKKTFDLILKSHPKSGTLGAIMSLSVEYPFISPQVIDDAINTLTIFRADSLLSVRPDHSMYYQHNGNGMHPILNQEKFTKLEREALYKGVGGIVLSTYEGFKATGKMVHGKVGHIVVDQRTAMGIFSEFDLQLIAKFYEDKQANVSF